ncbi:MAG: portal protein [bacterium]
MNHCISKLFLIHLEFKGLKKQYGLDTSSLRLSLNPPSDYKEQMDQAILEQRHRNYTELSREEEFSKYFLIKQYLQWDDDMIKENKEGHKKDIEFGLKKEEDEGGKG